MKRPSGGEAGRALPPFWRHRGPGTGRGGRAETKHSMATKATERDETEAAAPEQQSDGPLLDLTDAAVRRMIKLAKKRGYVTYDELNEVLPSEEFSSEQIEDVLGQLSEMGINVVEFGGSRGRAARQGAADAATTRSPRAASSSRRRTSRAPSSCAKPRRSRPTAPTIPCACICARWARSSFCRARARSPSPSASRPAARR